jgi:hypothetical protein
MWAEPDLALLEEVYELECIARMNAIYYESRLGRLQEYSFWMEVVTAATASGSGLAAVSFLQAGPGQWVWQILALTAALVAIIRPIYAPGKKIEAFTRQQQGYHANYFALKKLASNIRNEATVTPDHRRRYDTIFDRHVQLSTEDETPPNRKMLTEARRQTDVELPKEKFWWPATEGIGQAISASVEGNCPG